MDRSFAAGSRARHARGFSLLEVLVAFTVFAVAMGVLMQIFSRGVNGAMVADRYARASMYAESKLAAVGLDETIKEGSSSGKFDDDFAWQVTVRLYQDPAPKQQQTLDFEKLFFNQLFEIESKVSFTGDDQKLRTVTLTTLQLGPRT